MSCSGCAARREWINKWTKVAYERARGLFATDREAEPQAGRPSGDQHSSDTDPRTAGKRSRGDESSG
ncbi:hypothetical protein EGJ15_25170 [Pseudomonas sp. p99-361]|nr:hypothetical protein EGJ15_25170 [Pseudomonas sp. p99-361]